MEDFVCEWLEEDTSCSGNQKLSSDFLSALDAEVVVAAPGCELGAGGTVQVTNNFDILRVRVQMSASFANPTELPGSCGTGCTNPSDNGASCSCATPNPQGLVEVPPGTTRFVECALPLCTGCSTDCGNDPAECPFGDIHCTEQSNVKIKLKEISCDGGSNWTVLNANQVANLPWTKVTPCE